MAVRLVGSSASSQQPKRKKQNPILTDHAIFYVTPKPPAAAPGAPATGKGGRRQGATKYDHMIQYEAKRRAAAQRRESTASAMMFLMCYRWC